MKEKKENKKESKGCAIFTVITVLLAFWGFTSVMSGHSFLDGIFANLRILFFVGIIVLIYLGVAEMK